MLKLACQARDKNERILPNVFAQSQVGTPTATLISRRELLPSLLHGHKAPSDPVLSKITVFDGRCARVITDERNEITYLPYGADIFQKTAEIVLKVRTDLEAEITDLVPVQDSAVVGGTPPRGLPRILDRYH